MTFGVDALVGSVDSLDGAGGEARLCAEGETELNLVVEREGSLEPAGRGSRGGTGRESVCVDEG